MRGVDGSPAVLFVCHANLCRSPMAERLAAGLAGDRLRIASAGTHAEQGMPMHEWADATLRELGADPVGFRSQRVSPALLAQSDLVLTADRGQRSRCVELLPAAVRRTFTIRQFGRLASAVLAAGLRPGPETLLRDIAAVRGEVAVAAPEDDDLADPVLGTRTDFLACARAIAAALEPAVTLIASP
jgi:protein-tyrosine phosphatase